MGTERKGSLQEVVCYRPGDEAEGVDLEERKMRLRFAVRLLASLAGVT